MASFFWPIFSDKESDMSIYKALYKGKKSKVPQDVAEAEKLRREGWTENVPLGVEPAEIIAAVEVDGVTVATNANEPVPAPFVQLESESGNPADPGADDREMIKRGFEVDRNATVNKSTTAKTDKSK